MHPRATPANVLVIVIAACGGSSATPDAPAHDAPARDAATRDAATTHVVTASWSFATAAGSAVACPADGPTATLVSQPISDFQDLDVTFNNNGTELDDTADCSAGTLTSRALPVGLYRETLDFGSAVGSISFQSLPANIDLRTADQAYAPTPIAIDGGHVFVDWTIVLTGTTDQQDCSQAGVDTIQMVTTDEADPSDVVFDNYPCVGEESCTPGVTCHAAFGGGFTGTLPLGTFDIQLFALDADGHELGSGSATGVQLANGGNHVVDASADVGVPAP